MKISIQTVDGKKLDYVEADSHAKAIKKYSPNPVKKATAFDYDYVLHTVENGSVERTYWSFK